MSTKISIHADRCCNPYGNEGHVGKNLRKLSRNLKRKFPSLPFNAKICRACRDINQDDDDDDDVERSQSRDSLLDGEPHDATALDISEIYSSKLVKSQREIDLEEMLDGIKEKFKSLSLKDPQRLSILTIVPISWSAKK